MEPLTEAQRELYEWLVEYIRQAQHAPSIRQMMSAMNLKSPAPVQSRLERLQAKGYIDWTKGKARTMRILHPPDRKPGIKILGAIAAGGVVEQFTDVVESLDLTQTLNQPNCYGLRVVGDSMIEDLIAEGDLVIVKSVESGDRVAEGEIVAARVEGLGTTLKRFYRQGDKIVLKPANPRYQPIEVLAEQVEVQGVLVAVWRDYQRQN